MLNNTTDGNTSSGYHPLSVRPEAKLSKDNLTGFNIKSYVERNMKVEKRGTFCIEGKKK